MGLKTFVKGNGAFIIIWLQTKFGPKIVLSFFLMASATATVLHTSSTSFPGGKDKRGILGQICAPPHALFFFIFLKWPIVDPPSLF
jgi:hypothetical protein